MYCRFAIYTKHVCRYVYVAVLLSGNKFFITEFPTYFLQFICVSLQIFVCLVNKKLKKFLWGINKDLCSSYNVFFLNFAAGSQWLTGIATRLMQLAKWTSRLIKISIKKFWPKLFFFSAVSLDFDIWSVSLVFLFIDIHVIGFLTTLKNYLFS